MTSPTRPRSTQSGLQRTRVRSVISAEAYDRPCRLRQPPSGDKHRAGGSDDVQRARDHDLTVGRRREQCGADRVPDPVDDLDPLLGEPQIDRGLDDERRFERAWGWWRAAHQKPFEIADSERGQHLVWFLLAEETDHERARAFAEFLIERAPQRFRAGDVVRAVEEHERLTAHDLEPPRRLHARERVGHDVELQWRADEAFGGRDRDCRVVGLVRAVQWEEHIGILRTRASDVDESTADREHVARHPEIDVAAHDARRVALLEDGLDVRIRLTEHKRRAGLHDAGLLLCNLFARRSEIVDMIDADVGDHRDLAVDDVRRVPGSAHADLDYRDVDGLVGEPTERGRGHDVEIGRVDADGLLDKRDRIQHLVECVVFDRLTVDRHALVHALEVRAGVGPDLESERGEQLREHADGRGLAVRARDVDGRELDLGRTEVLHQDRDPLAGRPSPPAPGGNVEALQVDV